MTRKIILAADETIVCPKCQHKFPLDQGITSQTIERYASEFDQAFESQRREMEAQLTREAERKATKQFSGEIQVLKERLGETEKSAEEAKAALAKARAEAKAEAAGAFEIEKKALGEELAEKEAKLKEFRAQELALRAEKKKLEEERAGMELQLQRRLDEERQKFQSQIAGAEAEKFRLKEAEYQKKIADAQRANEELTRKLEQGSQQLQGEVLELELENTLGTAFRHDRIEEVKKGVRGADVIQTVCTPAGQVCGKIIWEAKRAEHWSDKWLEKLKDDQQEAKADIAVLVTTSMPKGVSEPFCRIGDVWVVPPHLMRPVAEALRAVLVESHRLKLVSTGKGEKMELLYNYLTSAQFAQKVRAIVGALDSMKKDLDAERRAFERLWRKREIQIERATLGIAGISGELQAIAHESLPQLETIEGLLLPGDDETGDEET